jgi:uncharacterized DUF497 family protein
MTSRFEWDDQKAVNNIAKHGVSFDEASTVFDNPLAALFDDDAHSEQETRELIIGHSAEGRLLIVIFTERAEGIVRIISARQATKQERHDYEENRSF